MFSLKWSPEAWSEYIDLQEHDKNAIKKANALLKDIQRNGYNASLGKFPKMDYIKGTSINSFSRFPKLVP